MSVFPCSCAVCAVWCVCCGLRAEPCVPGAVCRGGRSPPTQTHTALTAHTHGAPQPHVRHRSSLGRTVCMPPCLLVHQTDCLPRPFPLILLSSISLSQLVSCHDLFHDSHSPSSSRPQPQLPVSHNLPLKHLPPKPVPRHLLPSLFESHASAYDPTTDRPRPGIPGMRTTSLSAPTVLSSPVHQPRAGLDCGQATITQQTRTH